MRRFWTILGRSLRLRCPRCGQGKLFRGWFTMHKACEACGLLIEREPGYFLGSIYFNYGVTAFIVTISYFAAFFLTDIPPQVLLWSLTAFCVLFPIWFFRYARSLWMGLDELFDSRSGIEKLQLPEGVQARLGWLADKSTKGELTDDEKVEFDSLIETRNLLVSLKADANRKQC